MSEPQPRYGRVILKISGEGLCPPGGFGIHREPLSRVANEIGEVAALGVQVGVVLGGGNFLRGVRTATELGLEPATADYMGMLGTVLNCLALQDCLEHHGHPACVQSALTIARVCEPFDRRRCLEHFAEGQIVLLAAGTGNPHVTTDSCAAVRAIELKAEVLLKATKVDGVYDDDPVRNPAAKRYARVTYDQVIDGRLRVMDIAAVDLCQQHRVPVIVFNLFQSGSLRRVICGEPLGTFMGDA